MNCPECGNENKEHARFCSKCGAVLPRREEETGNTLGEQDLSSREEQEALMAPISQRKVKGRLNKKWLIGAALLCVVLFGLYYFLWNPNQTGAIAGRWRLKGVEVGGSYHGEDEMQLDAALEIGRSGQLAISLNQPYRLKIANLKLAKSKDGYILQDIWGLTLQTDDTELKSYLDQAAQFNFISKNSSGTYQLSQTSISGVESYLQSYYRIDVDLKGLVEANKDMLVLSKKENRLWINVPYVKNAGIELQKE